MPSVVVRCATAPPPNGPNSPGGVARCSRCSRQLESSNSADMQDNCNGGTRYGFERECLCSAVSVGWQRRLEYGDPVYERPVPGLPPPFGYPRGPGHPPQRYIGVASHHGTLETVLGRG